MNGYFGPLRVRLTDIICVRCRALVEGRLVTRHISEGADAAGAPTLACECGATYAIVDGIPVVLAEPTDCALVIDAAGRDGLASVYLQAPPSPFSTWLAAEVARAPRPVVELGSGLGHDATIAVDTNLALLRARGQRGNSVCADALDPPFLAGFAGTVVLANVLDSCRDPFTLVAQADALLRPGGRMIVGCAYAFQETVTPRAGWFTEADLRGAFTGMPFGGYEISCKLDEEIPALEWRLRLSQRTEHRHDVHVLVGVKP